ncbi:MAG: hypothetical protein IT490_01130 [Candidatus Contendobacter sp.]|nr:hypothetical protein [Candidatus Contendobacter sp.]
MCDALILLMHLVATIERFLTRGGARTIVAESVLLKQQLLVLNRAHQRVPNLRPVDHIVAALCAGWMHPTRVMRAANVIQFHRALVQQKNRLLFTPTLGSSPARMACSGLFQLPIAA